jgi:hypothetical protein
VRRLLALCAAVLAAALTAALHARPGTATSSTQFRTPDAGAACRVEGAALACSSLASTGSVALRRHAPAAVVTRPIWWDASTPVLETWEHAGIACRLDGGAIFCASGRVAVRVGRDGFAVAS